MRDVRRAIVSGVAIFLLTACAQDGEPAHGFALMEDPPPDPVDLAWDGGSEPGLTRTPPTEGAFEHPRLPPAPDRLRNDGPATLVARVRIHTLSADLHTAPANVDWRPGSVSTEVSATILDILCGSGQVGRQIRFRYLGGKTPSGETMWTSDTPILEIDSEPLVVVDDHGGNLYLVRGNVGVFDEGAMGEFSTRTGEQISDADVRSLCQ